MTTDEKIVEILKQHPEGGEKFFNALDIMLRSDHSIGKSYIDWVTGYDYENMKVPVFNMVTKRYDFTKLNVPLSKLGVILTGRFGHYIMSNFARKISIYFEDVVVVNGGIREGNQPEIFKTEFPCNHYILLDDSYYSGATATLILSAMHKIDPRVNLVQAFVVYDGSKENNGTVKSMFRYYGEEKVNGCD